MKRHWIARPAAAMLVALIANAANAAQAAGGISVPGRVEALLRAMSLDEKVGQLNQLSDKEFLTGSHAATFINAFNTLNGVPATASSVLQRAIPKRARGVKGFVVSDWGLVREMVVHGYASDLPDAAAKRSTPAAHGHGEPRLCVLAGAAGALGNPVSSIVRPLQELKGFKKVMLQPGQQQPVESTSGRDSLAFVHHKLERVAGPGQFQLMVGAASNDSRLRETIQLTHRSRFFPEASPA